MRAPAIYKALLRCYPAAFRQEYGGQMLLMFADQLDDARRSGRPLELVALWLRAVTDALTVAPREHVHILQQDVRYALRTMAGKPGFTVITVMTLALGIGANTAIFSLWNGVLRAPLPGVSHPEELVMLSTPTAAGMWRGRLNGPRIWLTYAEFEQLRDHAGSFSGLMASQSSLSAWQVRSETGAWSDLRGRLVSREFFELLGVRPAVGRFFTSAAGDANTPIAVISYNYWQRRFGGSNDVLGSTLSLRTATATIVGVAPAGFIGETSGQLPDAWFPLHLQPAIVPGGNWLHDAPPDKVMWLHVFGRLKPGVTLPQAEAEANAIFQRNLETFYGARASGDRRSDFLDQSLRISPAVRGASSMVGEFASSLSVLLTAVGVLLLIACGNLANLLLARGTARRSEMALRLSLGAPRERLIRQLVTESFTLSAFGGVAALAVAYGLHGVIVRMLAESEPQFHMPFAIDALMVGFLATATLAASILFGAIPAWQASRIDLVTSLNDQSRGAAGSTGQLRAGRLLVALQLALSLPLLVGAGLLTRTVLNLQRVDLGYSADGLVVARVDLGAAFADAPRRDRLLRELLAEVNRVPGVESATFSQLGLFSGGNSTSPIEVEGYTPNGNAAFESDLDRVGPGYFTALGVPMRVGRDIHETDRRETIKVCVVNEAFAKRYFEGRNPIGLHVSTVADGTLTPYQVVGVAANGRIQQLRGEVEPRFFVPAEQRPSGGNSRTFLVRTIGDSMPIIAALHATTDRTGGPLTIASATTLNQQIAPLTAQDATLAELAVVFGLVALALATIGLYGVLSHGVARRTNEIAIRMALGARSGRVISMILRETSGLVLVGLALGGGLAYVAARSITNRLYGIDPQDPFTVAGAILLLLAAALFAAFVPARKAAQLDPMTALRHS